MPVEELELRLAKKGVQKLFSSIVLFLTYIV